MPDSHPLSRIRFLPLWLGLLMTLTLHGGEPPATGEIDRVIQELGHEEFPVRRAAFQQLQGWSKSHPRLLLTQMARAYPGNRDMEISTRLEELMEPLAIRWLLALPPGFIGINMGWRELPGGKHGVEVSSVLDGQPAKTWGLRQEDVILELNGESVSAMGSLDVFSERVASLPPGTFVELRVLRGGDRIVLPVRLGPRPDERNVHQGARQRYEAWLRALARTDADFDPDFPVGHFPME